MQSIFNPMLAQRREWKLRLLELLQEYPDDPKRVIMARFSLETGLKMPTIIEYYEELLDAGVIQDVKRYVS